MVDVAMVVIPEPEPGTRSILLPPATFPPSASIQGETPDGVNYKCGGCGGPIADNLGKCEADQQHGHTLPVLRRVQRDAILTND